MSDYTKCPNCNRSCLIDDILNGVKCIHCVDKESLEPINVRCQLKKFIYHMKQILKERSNSFFSDNKTLMYYLSDSPKFVKDYEKCLSVQKLIKEEST